MKKLMAFVLALACVMGLVGCFSSPGIANTESTKSPEDSEPVENAEKVLLGDFILLDLKNMLVPCLGEGESLSDVQFVEDHIFIFVNLSNSNPAPDSFANLALVRAIDITDAILSDTELDALWNIITIEFGDVGTVRCTKSDIETIEQVRHIRPALFEAQLGIDDF